MLYNKDMNPEIQNKLIALNDQFYQTFGAAFAATRLRIQSGIRQLMDELPPTGAWLDLGCGNGALGKLWAEQQRSGCYFGLDFSDELLEHARLLTDGLENERLNLRYAKAGMTDKQWPVEDATLCAELFGEQSGPQFDGVMCFAALHHIPGTVARLEIMRHVCRVLKPGGVFIHSEWQFQHSTKLMERRLPWSEIGLQDEDVEAGDTLLDWRYGLPGQQEQIGYRYVHLFSEEELTELARQSGFVIQKNWGSDGKSGNLAIYQTWQRID